MQANVLMVGLDDGLASELRSALPGVQHMVKQHTGADTPSCLDLLRDSAADVVFCCPRSASLTNLLNAVSSYRPGLPVIVVTRHPEVNEWLNAIEAGATDYCAAPFEMRHLEWILKSSLR
jgi:DNA-binding NtrC family response regulator